MTKLKKLTDCLATSKGASEVYSTEEKRYKKRGSTGLYSKSNTAFDFINLIGSWEQVVGKMIAEHSIPLKLNFGNLIILTQHSVFSNELQLMQTELIKKIELILPALKGNIKKIKFIMSESFFQEQKMKNNAGKNLKEKKKLHPYSPIYQELKEKADLLFQEIEDDELKEIMISLYIDSSAS